MRLIDPLINSIINNLRDTFNGDGIHQGYNGDLSSLEDNHIKGSEDIPKVNKRLHDGILSYIVMQNETSKDKLDKLINAINHNNFPNIYVYLQLKIEANRAYKKAYDELKEYVRTEQDNDRL